jgi:hypothetical protein
MFSTVLILTMIAMFGLRATAGGRPALSAYKRTGSNHQPNAGQ